MEEMRKKRTVPFLFAAAAALAGFLFFSVLSGRAEAGDYDPRQIAMLEAAIDSLETTLTGNEFVYRMPLKDQMKEEINRVGSQAAYYNFLVQRDKRLEQEYQADHAMLTDIVWTDRTFDIQSLYSQLAGAHAQSFAGSMNVTEFRNFNPGYQTSPDAYLHFSQIYKDRMAEWNTYAKGVLDANEREAQSVMLFQAQKVGIAGLQNASENASGDLQLLQADNQIYNMGAQLTERLRIDVNRQTEARTRFALDERQEKTDEHAAFNQAVRWRTQTQGQNY
ncbi:MAG: hypothetical protein LBO82_10405 [Synergistaceae bacterium]|jgi:conjugal transfer/entry exclusion protein|nr:hypothetical protein [Synergistaceae bacterium]